MPTRESLGDNDPACWLKNSRGEPQDIWVPQTYLPLLDIETGEVLCFVSGSRGGDQALRALMRDYKPKARTSEVPIISLQKDSYVHDDYGRVQVPVLRVVGWHDLGYVPPAPARVTVAQLSARPMAMQIIHHDVQPENAEPEEADAEPAQQAKQVDSITTGPQPQPSKAKLDKMAAKAAKGKKAADPEMDDSIPF
jgi:hypothetical protein